MRHDVLATELQALITCERAVQNEYSDASRRQDALAQELEYKIYAGLQWIAHVVMSQQGMVAPQVVEQLNAATEHILALGRVHHRLHLMTNRDNADFNIYLFQLCQDLSALLHDREKADSFAVHGSDITFPMGFSMPQQSTINGTVIDSVTWVDLTDFL